MAAPKYKNNQIPGIIEEVTVDCNTFEKETFKPTLINYFYGKNGTGKSTISGFLRSPLSPCKTTVSRNQFELLVYNNDFITEEIQSYGNIPGLFTITKTNAVIKNEIEKLEAEKKELDKEKTTLQSEMDGHQKKLDKIEKGLLEDVWSVQTRYTRLYPLAVSTTNSKKSFLAKIQDIASVYHDEEAIKAQYEQSFLSKESARPLFRKVPESIDVPDLILSEPIINSGSTPFAGFVKELRSLDWVKKGHDIFQHAAGDKCPYCQQTLPVDFEEMVASCFDQGYQRQIDELKRSAESYTRKITNILQSLEYNYNLNYRPDNYAEYSRLYGECLNQAKIANETWQRKISEPASLFKLPDISRTLHEINVCIDGINEETKEYNAAIENRKQSQKKCTDMIWEQMAFDCANPILRYETLKEPVQEQIQSTGTKMNENTRNIDSITEKIGRLSKDTVNTTAAKDNINQLIRDAGFQGFEIREKKNAQYVYELVRKDGTVVKSLSEGERNFIGFLYFYNIVMNSRSDDGVQRDKVVVIDDPVSSMDSSALFSVAALVRNLEEICYNNYSMESSEDDPKFIKQFICLTHNPFFFKEISYNHISDYECTNFYELSKDADNHSHIRLCHKEEERKYVNYSPIKNNYEALWAEYRSTTDSVILMNVIRRILEYYFVQIGGFKENDLRKNLLDKNKHSFPSKQEYDAAAAMIAYLNTGIAGFDDGLYFDANAVSVDQMRSVFKNIFYVLNQGQHYEYMMG